MHSRAQQWITALDLDPHPEGGYYREVYRSDETMPAAALPERFGGERAISTSIYFLLGSDQVSRLHRIRSDETWHFYDGSGLTIHSIWPDGGYHSLALGLDPGRSQLPQRTIRRGVWFGATVDDPASYALVGCTVAPGFDFRDFELGNRDQLLARYPQHRKIILRLTS